VRNFKVLRRFVKLSESSRTKVEFSLNIIRGMSLDQSDLPLSFALIKKT
jgi:hypothetical protein